MPLHAHAALLSWQDPTRQNRKRRNRYRCPTLILLNLLVLIHLLPIQIHVHAIESSTIPRSTNRYSNYPTDLDSPNANIHSPSNDSSAHPPWNPSPQISPTGYLSHLYPRSHGTWEQSANLRGRYGPRSKFYNSLSSIPVRIRQVPGDGNCLFHSIAVVLSKIENGTELAMDSPRGIYELRKVSMSLRNRAVDALQSVPRRRLFLQGEEYLEARELLMAAASQFDLEGGEYCDLMRRESYWGGGPEIVALCNCLQRPIHIYELIPAPKPPEEEKSPPNKQSNTQPISTQFTLRRMACFGSPKFDRRTPLHILSADSRFPDIDPRKIRKVGNHFLALFPVEDERKHGLWKGNREVRFKRHALIRGGTNEGVKVKGCDGVKDEKSDEIGFVGDHKAKVERWDGGRGSWSI